MAVCTICMEPRIEMTYTTAKCSHTYCIDCITKHISAKVQENITSITCLEFNCKETLEPKFFRDIISCQVLDQWLKALLESSEEVHHRIGDEDLLLIQLAEKNKWKKCPGCKYYVERASGCLHITCRCGSEFCYGCGSNWSASHESICQRA